MAPTLPNARSDIGQTPLHAAAHKGDAETINALKEGGAHLNSRDDAGKSPLDIAKSEGHKNILNLLKRPSTK